MTIPDRALPFIGFFGVLLGGMNPLLGLGFQVGFCALQLFYLHRPKTPKAVFDSHGPAMTFSLLMNLMMVSPLLSLSLCAGISVYALYSYLPMPHAQPKAAASSFGQTPGTISNGFQPRHSVTPPASNTFSGTGYKLGRS